MAYCSTTYMLAGEDDSENRIFYSLTKGKIWRILSLPEAIGKKCIETKGWLLVEGIYGELGLLHPFSRVRINLPHQTTFPDYKYINVYPPHFISRAVLSVDPSDTPDFILAVIYGSPGMLGILRSGDMYWTRIETLYQDERPFLTDVVFHCGKVCAIDIIGRVWIWDISRSNDPPNAQFLLSISTEVQLVPRVLYLVESSDTLLIVERKGESVGGTDTRSDAVIDFQATKPNFQVMQLDLIEGNCTQIMSLGDKVIFIAYNGTCSVDTTRLLGVIKPNCIYFVDQAMDSYVHRNDYNMGVYHLQDGNIEPFGDLNIDCSPI